MSEAEKTPEPTPADRENSAKKQPSPFAAIFGIFRKIKALGLAFYDAIWAPAGTRESSCVWRGFSLVWRIVEITIARTLSNRIPLQAAALTYYFLMALAPFVIFVLTIFGVVMNVRGDEAVETVKLRLAETMQLIAPEASGERLEAAAGTLSAGALDTTGVPDTTGTTAVPKSATVAFTTVASDLSATNISAAGTPDAENVTAAVAPELLEFANNLLESMMRNSGSAGTLGFIVLAVLAVFLVSHIEDAYNLMWNVKLGRSWGKRFLVYFLFLVFGGAVLAVSASMLSVSDSFKRISEMTGSVPDWAVSLPGGEAFFGFMTSFAPTLLVFVVLSLAFACLNKYMPRTSVRFGPALIGGAFVALVFIVNQKLTVIYLKKISEFNAIYGNLGVVFILLLLLYVGWIILLLGGQLSYAVQNARYLKNQNREWADLSPRAKQEAFFACLSAIFSVCSRRDIGLTPSRLSSELCIPAVHVVECLDVLKNEKLIVALDETESGEPCYNTAGTVAAMTLGELKKRFDNLRSPLVLGGNAEVRAALARFSALFDSAGDTVTLGELFAPAAAADSAPAAAADSAPAQEN